MISCYERIKELKNNMSSFKSRQRFDSQNDQDKPRIKIGETEGDSLTSN
jgi:hypothetical protein